MRRSWEGTIKVMGGEDWMDWMDALTDAGVLADHAVTVAYSYIGPELTYPIYTEGTIGQAKKHLTETAGRIHEKHPGIQAYISVNKALVTQASAAIPIVPLYFAILYKVMKEQGTHEGCIEQISRLFHDKVLLRRFPQTHRAASAWMTGSWHLRYRVLSWTAGKK